MGHNGDWCVQMDEENGVSKEALCTYDYLDGGHWCSAAGRVCGTVDCGANNEGTKLGAKQSAELTSVSVTMAGWRVL